MILASLLVLWCWACVAEPGSAEAATYEVRYMLPLELLFPILLLYSISCAKIVDVPKGERRRKAPFPPEFERAPLAREGAILTGKMIQSHFPLAKSGLAPILLPP